MNPQRKRFIFITGVSSGIGHGAVGYLIKQGFHVIGSVRSSQDQTRLTEEFPAHFTCLKFDVTDHLAVAEAAKEVDLLLQGELLAALVNNAGSSVPGPIQLLEREHFEQQIQINLFGTRNVTNALLPHLGASSSRPAHLKPGKIINISSISGIFNTPINGTYCVSKHAIESLGEVYRRELYMYGIDVISIQPGPIHSEIWSKNQRKMERFQDSDYATMIRKTEDILEEARAIAQPTEVISALILKIIQTKKPRPAYIVHSKKWLITALARWLAPRWVDQILHRKLS